jgi:hypothetical protein
MPRWPGEKLIGTQRFQPSQTDSISTFCRGLWEETEKQIKEKVGSRSEGETVAAAGSK